MKRCQSVINLMAVAFVCSVYVLLISSDANAQSITDGSTPLALSPGSPAGAYSLSDFDSVNPYNGNLGFRLPLVKIAGRGGAGYSMVARSEQKWLVDKQPQPGQPTIYTPNPNWWNGTEFRPIYSMGHMDMRQAGSNDYIIACGAYIHRETLTRLTFTAPDGTEYELRDQLTNGRPDHPTCSTGFNRGRVFITGDGTSATFTSDSDISDYIYDNPANIPPSGYLSMRDGTRYRIDGGMVNWMRDRNGNKITFSYDTYQRVTTITDSLNRQVTINYGQVGPYDSITYKGFGGTSRTIKVYQNSLQYALRSDFSIQTLQQLFPELNGAYSVNNNPPVITAIELPNGQQYHFYYNSYAELARVVLPTGGAIEYDYAAGLTDGAASGVLPIYNGDKHIYRRVIERRVYPDGGSGAGYASRMTYSRPESSTYNAGYVIVDQYNSSGGLLTRSYHYYYGSARASFNQEPTQYPGWKDGREYQTTVYAADGTTPLRQITNTFAQRTAVSWWTGGADQEPPNDPRVTETDTTLMDTNQVSKQTFGYDDSVPYNNRNNVKEYDFGSGAAGGLVRETRTTFVTSTSYTDTSVSLLSLPSQVSIYDGSGSEKARTTFEYDNYISDGGNHAGLVYRSSISGFDSSFSTSYTTRGNVTATTHTILMNGSGSISSYAQYDVAGNVVNTIDARGYATNFDFSDRFGSPDYEAIGNNSPSELSSVGQASYAFPTLVTNAANHTAYTQFDYYLGSPVNVQDANGIVFAAYYNEALDRPTQVIRDYNNVSSKSQTSFSYDDTGRSVTTTSDQASYLDNALKTQTFYDGFGRTTEGRQYEGGANYIAVQTQYDALGRAYKTSNPFRPWQSEVAIWTTTAFDALSRATSITTPDSAVATTSYSGNAVTVTDQNSKSRKSVTDALGRLTSVYEDPSGLNYLTSYSYDALDDLTGVTQGSQTRSFAYDSLKRLTSGTNPESGTVGYAYDNNGNLTQKTDARGITTTFAYDALNRVTTRSYQNDPNNTAPVSYFYDSQGLPAGAPSYSHGYATGRLVAVTYGSGSSAGDYYGFDALGRQSLKIQQTGGINYQTAAVYNLAGAITAETYPSGHTVNYSYDQVGRVSSFAGNLGNGTTIQYATQIGYDASSHLQEERFGTVFPLYHYRSYNERGQLIVVVLGGYYGSANRGAILNYYSARAQALIANSGPDNNGNLLQSEAWVSTGQGDPVNPQKIIYDIYRDVYAYDSLNRLMSVAESIGKYSASQAVVDVLNHGIIVNITPSISQQYSYDQYGNMTAKVGTAGANQPWLVDSATNRLQAPPSPKGKVMLYDEAGNLTYDTYTGAGTRVYDAENRMVSAAETNVRFVYYNYDADGRRVRRILDGQEWWQVYGMDGELLAEYVAGAAPANPYKEYGYRGGQLLATATDQGDLRWLVPDHLGTPRMVADNSGTLASLTRHDYLPFGEELFAGTGGRTTSQGYSQPDGVRFQFTDKERDNETGLDYFLARYYSSTQGRFTSVDPENAGANPSHPQSWNGYSYVWNRPTVAVDPDGETIKICDNEGRCSEVSDADANKYTFNKEYARTHGFAVSGNKIFDSQGNQVGTWVRTSFDDLNDFANGVIFGSGNTAGLHQRLAPVQKVAKVELHIIAAFSVPVVEAGEIATLSIEATEEATTAATPAAVEAAPQAASALKNAITGFTKHGINSAISHDGVGVSSRAILNTLRNPIKVVPQSGGRVKVVGQEAIVILNRAGKVITTWAKSGAATRVK